MTASNSDAYGNLFTVLLVFQFPCWWIDTGANVLVHAATLCSHLTRPHWISPS
jgi:hypothetical protein